MTRLITTAVIAAGLGLAAILTFRAEAKPEGNLVKPALPFGLAGDGTADDTEALQKAVDAGVGSIRLPKGVYRITKPIVVDLDKIGPTSFSSDGTARIVMTGPGPALRFIGTHLAGTADPKTVKPEVWERQRTPCVDGLEIVGAHAEADGIEANGTFQLTVTRTTLRKLRHGIHLVKRNRNVIVADSHIYENRGIGIYYDDVNLHQSNITGCHISYCGGGGVVSRGGDVRNIQITGCDVESNMSADGPPTANVLLDCSGGSVAEVAITGCTIQHNDKGKDSANVRILGAGAASKKSGKTSWGHVTITGNVLSDVQHNIDIENARGVTITGNTFWMAYHYNLRVRDSEQIVVGPNAFERNPHYAYGTALECKNAILFQSCLDCTVTGLHVHHVYGVGAAITVDGCKRFNITGCTVLDCDCTGMLLKEVSDSRVSGCLIRNDLKTKKQRSSLRVAGGRGNLFAGNLLGKPFEIPKEAGTSQGNVTAE